MLGYVYMFKAYSACTVTAELFTLEKKLAGVLKVFLAISDNICTS